MVPTCPTTEAALQTGLLPTQEQRKGRFAKASACGLVGFSTQATRRPSETLGFQPNLLRYGA